MLGWMRRSRSSSLSSAIRMSSCARSEEHGTMVGFLVDARHASTTGSP